MVGEVCTSGRLSRSQSLHPLVVLCVVKSHASVRRLHWPIAVFKLLLRATCPASLRPSALLCCAAAWSECSLIRVATTTAAPERGIIVVFMSTRVFIVIRGKDHARSSQVELPSTKNKKVALMLMQR